ncbi:MAG: DUF4230 domain-containing protein [Patescibacteria group bacterium]
MKKSYLIILLALSSAFTVWWLHAPRQTQTTQTLVQVSPAVISAVLKEIRLETVHVNLTETVESTRTRQFWFGGVDMESATFIATGVAHAGFPEGAIHLEQLSANRVSLRLDAPAILSLEDKLHVVAYDSIWSDMHFQEQARAQARAQLLVAACKSDILALANESAKERITAMVLRVAPSAVVDIHTAPNTEEKNCSSHVM